MDVLEPKQWVPLKRPGKQEDNDDDDDIPYNPYEINTPKPHIPKRTEGISLNVLVISLMVICVVLLSTLFLAVAILYQKRKKKYMYSGGRSVMTFSNPNYYTSNGEVTPAPPAPNDKKPFLWKRLKYDKSQVNKSFILIVVYDREF